MLRLRGTFLHCILLLNSYSTHLHPALFILMKHLLTIAAIVGICAGSARAAEPLNTVCPISGKPANPAITSNYTKTVAVCCNKCKAQFNAAPKGYLSNILAAVSGQCPLSKKKSDPSITVSYSRSVAFADAASKAAFDAAPDKHIKNVRQ